MERLWLILFVVPLFAQDNEMVEEIAIAEEKKHQIISIGEGPSRDSAITDALRNAIEIALGTYVTSITENENYEVIKDKITSLSRGFVKKFVVIDEVVINDVYMTTVSATITKEEIIDFAPSVGVEVKVAGGLFAQQFALEDDEKKREFETILNLVNSSIFDNPIFNPEIVLGKPFRISESTDSGFLSKILDTEIAIEFAIHLNPINENMANLAKFTSSALRNISLNEYRIKGMSPTKIWRTDNSSNGSHNRWDGTYKDGFVFENVENEYSRFQKTGSILTFVENTGFPKHWMISQNGKTPAPNLVFSLDENSFYFPSPLPHGEEKRDYNVTIGNYIAYELKNEKSVNAISNAFIKAIQNHTFELNFKLNNENILTKKFTINFGLEQKVYADAVAHLDYRDMDANYYNSNYYGIQIEGSKNIALNIWGAGLNDMNGKRFMLSEASQFYGNIGNHWIIKVGTHYTTGYNFDLNITMISKALNQINPVLYYLDETDKQLKDIHMKDPFKLKYTKSGNFNGTLNYWGFIGLNNDILSKLNSIEIKAIN